MAINGVNGYQAFTGTDPYLQQMIGLSQVNPPVNQPVITATNPIQQDTVEISTQQQTEDKQGLSKGAKVAIGTGIAIALAIGADYIFCKGRHVDDLWKALKNKFKPEVKAETKAEQKATQQVKPEPKTETKVEQNARAEAEQTAKTEPKVETKVEQKVEQQVKPEPKTETKVEQKVEQQVKPEPKAETKVEQNARAEAEQTAKLTVENDLQKLTQDLPNMSRTELARLRYELSKYSGDISQLQIKAKKEGLTQLEQVKLNSLKKQLELVKNREAEIEKSLLPFRPTVSDTSAVSMHHGLNGENTYIRWSLKGEKGLEGLDEFQKQHVLSMPSYMGKVDKEFAQLPPLEKDCIVYRGRTEQPCSKSANTDFLMMDTAKVGDRVVPDTAYSYTAFDRKLAETWGGEGARGFKEDGSLTRTIMYEIHLPKGAKVSRNLEHGGEVVMPRGAEYIVKDKKVDKEGCMEVVLEYILPKTKPS